MKLTAAGKYKGRRPSVDPAKVRALHGEGLRPSEIARRLGIARTTVWRALKVSEI